MEKFCRYFASLLKKSGITKANLSRSLGLKRQNYIGNIISGIHTPTISKVKKIAKLLKCSEREKNKLIQLAINERGTTKIKNIVYYPELRNALFLLYSEGHGENIATKAEIKKEINPYPLHPIELKLLQEAFNKLIKIGIAETDQNPISYFINLPKKDLGEILEESGLEWYYNQKLSKFFITFKQGKGISSTIAL